MAAAGIGAAVGAVSEANQQAAGYFMAREASDQAWKRQKRVLQNQIQWRVADLRAAGLNPILAAQSAFGGGAPSVAQTQVPQSRASAGAEAGINAALKGTQREQAKAGIRNLDSDSKLKTAATTTELGKQVQLQAAAEQSIATARREEAMQKLIEAQSVGAEGIAEMWETPGIRQIMQGKQLFNGVPLPRRLPGKGIR